MRIVLGLNDPPYRAEHSYNGLQQALTLAKQDQNGAVTVFLMADAVICAKKGQEGVNDCRERGAA